MKRQKRIPIKTLFEKKIVRGLLVFGTVCGLLLTILSFSVACIWGGDEAVGFVHMTELVAAALCQKDMETVGEALLADKSATPDAGVVQTVPGTAATSDASVPASDVGVGTNASAVPDTSGTATTSGTGKGTANVSAATPDTSEAASGKVNAEEQPAVRETAEERRQRELEERIAAAEYPFYIKVNRSQCCITVYAIDEEGGYTIPYKAMVCSTGLYNRTPAGKFRISDKYVWRDLNGGVCGQYASRVHKGVLFHSVPYYSHSKNALCSSKYNQLGEQASAGCIRLTVADAKWIYDYCPSGTTVEIYDDEEPGPLGKPEAEKIDLESPNKGWDPTDPDENNPWRTQEESVDAE